MTKQDLHSKMFLTNSKGVHLEMVDNKAVIHNTVNHKRNIANNTLLKEYFCGSKENVACNRCSCSKRVLWKMKSKGIINDKK